MSAIKVPTFAATVLRRTMLRKRISAAEAHYAGDLVEGAHMLELFGDLATELSILQDGHEGLMRAYESVEFLAPVRAGDYIEAHGALLTVGRTSRRMAFEAYKTITSAPHHGDGAANALEQPVLVARAIGITVTPLESQRSVGGEAVPDQPA